jgi:polyhydroxyalkanoate synthesis regulator phasin
MSYPITFDTWGYMEELLKSGITHEHAEAITKATAKAFNQFVEVKDLATKKDIQDLRMDIQKLKMELQAFVVKSAITTVSLLSGLQIFFHFVK